MKKSLLNTVDTLIVIFLLASLVHFADVTYQNHLRHQQYQTIVQALLPYQHGVNLCFEQTEDLKDCHEHYKTVPETIKPNHHHKMIRHLTVSEGGIITVSPQRQYGIEPDDRLILKPRVHHSEIYWYASGKAVIKGYAG